ncbi:MAG TPA: hypothetical protein VGZ32_18050 [Actinocrinis sp.]|uniref:hypothetical protein n=1 Tax=Actinocrinis sp. TaxID=1920516 RepID=UPI002DDCE83D|nr:hypothetical protein [Actinocrinis sp.]HEV3172258.1 hypothetical protein [Actinocrinis sp.]
MRLAVAQTLVRDAHTAELRANGAEVRELMRRALWLGAGPAAPELSSEPSPAIIRASIGRDAKEPLTTVRTCQGFPIGGGYEI